MKPITDPQQILLDKAIQIAVAAHKGVANSDKTPYITHPLRLMNNATTVDEQIVAILHDTIEDTTEELNGDANVTVESLIAAGFPLYIVDAINALSKISYSDGTVEKYDLFIERISMDALATKVKLLDLYDNIDLTRLPNTPNSYELERAAKYHRAIRKLQNS